LIHGCEKLVSVHTKGEEALAFTNMRIWDGSDFNHLDLQFHMSLWVETGLAVGKPAHCLGIT